MRAALEPVFDLYKNLDRFIGRIANQVQLSQASHARTVTIEQPNSVLGLLATSAPHLLIQLFFALLVIFFFLAGWTSMRKKTIVSRGSFEGALDRPSHPAGGRRNLDLLGTITLINVGLGGLTAWPCRGSGCRRR